jgi:sugar O-acyltransferase (sialic acid O-acetyltransferase NeuD family)
LRGEAVHLTPDAIVLVGAGGHARSCIDVLEREGRFTIAGLFAHDAEVGSDVLGYPVLGGDESIAANRARAANALVVVGQITTPDARIRLFELLRQNGFALPVIVSPRAYVSAHATIGEGSIVMHGATVNAGVVVGRNCILNSHCLVEHDTTVGDHCHVSTAATINGGVRVGAGTFVGSGSNIREAITIGDRCVIGIGQTVLTDCAPGTRLPSAPKDR